MFSKLSRVLLAALMTFASASQALAQTKEEFARDIYLNLPGREANLARYQDGHILVGVNVNQKNDENGGFCRASAAVYPGAEISYACYGELLTGDEARAAYEGSRESAIQVLFSIDGSTMVGSAWAEKTVSLPEFGVPLLCVKTNAVVPNPVPSYTCFRELVPIGGGASIGN